MARSGPLGVHAGNHRRHELSPAPEVRDEYHGSGFLQIDLIKTPFSITCNRTSSSVGQHTMGVAIDGDPVAMQDVGLLLQRQRNAWWLCLNVLIAVCIVGSAAARARYRWDAHRGLR